MTEILPKTSDKADAAYAVPFPQTERRELYVLVKPDPVAAAPAATDHAGPTNSCGVGRWVSVTREAGWVPSTSMMWRSIGDHAATLTTRAGTVVTAALKPFTTEAAVAADEPATTAPQQAGTPAVQPQPQPVGAPVAAPAPQSVAAPAPRPAKDPNKDLAKAPAKNPALTVPTPIVDPETTATTAPVPDLRAGTVPLPPQRPQEFLSDSAEPKRARREQRAER